MAFNMRNKNKKIGVQLTFLAFFCLIFLIVTQIITYFGIEYFTLEKAKDYSENTTAIIEGNIKSTIKSIYLTAYNVSFNKFVQDYMTEDNEDERIRLNSYIFEMIQYLSRTNENINDIVIIDNIGRKLSYNAYLDPVTEKNILSRYEAEKKVNRQYYLIDDIQNANPGVFSVIMPIVSNRATKENFGEHIGICIIVCNNKSINAGMQDTLITKDAISAVLNSKSDILASYVGNSSLEDRLKIGFPEGFGSVRISNKEYAVYNKKIDTGGWRIINITSKNELLQDYFQYRMLSILVGLLSIIVVSFVIFLAIRNIYVPISEISKFLKKPNLNMRERIGEITYNNEISDISQDINTMLDNHEEMTKRIFTQQDKLYEMELINKEAQLTNLFNQINPHFLYNTLENIRSLGIINKDDRIVEISTSLASVLRYSIKSSTFVLLEDEIECVRNYMKIINIRYGGEIKLAIDIDDDIAGYKILKMVLQPIVENSIRHGFDESRNGLITITGKAVEGDMTISVVDNGSGITDERLDYVRKSLDNPDEKDSYLGIGLNNINKRIKLNFGDSYGLTIDSDSGKGAVVTIRIPLIK